jgi:hypothetical protein
MKDTKSKKDRWCGSSARVLAYHAGSPELSCNTTKKKAKSNRKSCTKILPKNEVGYILAMQDTFNI